MLRFEVLTLFPEIFSSFLDESLIKRAIEKELLSVSLVNFRKHGIGKRIPVDFGGVGTQSCQNCIQLDWRRTVVAWFRHRASIGKVVDYRYRTSAGLRMAVSSGRPAGPPACRQNVQCTLSLDRGA